MKKKCRFESIRFKIRSALIRALRQAHRMGRFLLFEVRAVEKYSKSWNSKIIFIPCISYFVRNIIPGTYQYSTRYTRYESFIYSLSSCTNGQMRHNYLTTNSTHERTHLFVEEGMTEESYTCYPRYGRSTWYLVPGSTWCNNQQQQQQQQQRKHVAAHFVVHSLLLLVIRNTEYEIRSTWWNTYLSELTIFYTLRATWTQHCLGRLLQSCRQLAKVKIQVMSSSMTDQFVPADDLSRHISPTIKSIYHTSVKCSCLLPPRRGDYTSMYSHSFRGREGTFFFFVGF